MIIWSGYGILAAIIIFLDSLMINIICLLIVKEPNYYDRNHLPFGISMLLSSLIIKLFANYFDKKRKEGNGTRFFDKITISDPFRNTLLFVPFQYWSLISLVLGIILIVHDFAFGK